MWTKLEVSKEEGKRTVSAHMKLTLRTRETWFQHHFHKDTYGKKVMMPGRDFKRGPDLIHCDREGLKYDKALPGWH